MAQISTNSLSNNNKFSSAFVDGHLAVGVDLAKHVFQVCYINAENNKVINKSLKRTDFEEFIKKSSKLHLAFEACGSCNYWGRLAIKYHHKVTIIPCNYAKAASIADKDDKRDAFKIREYLCNNLATFIRVKTEEEQAIMSLLLIRDRQINERTRCFNQLKAFLFELGVVCQNSNIVAIEKAENLLQDNSLSPIVKQAISHNIDIIKTKLDIYNKAIAKLDDQIKNWSNYYTTSRLLQTVPGIGPLSALCLTVAMGDPKNFPTSKHFASYVGFCPSHSGSGGRNRTLSISHRGNRVLKKILYQAAMANYIQRVKKEDSKWIISLKERNKPTKVIVGAIADKMCRVAWAIAKTQKPYNHTVGLGT